MHKNNPESHAFYSLTWIGEIFKIIFDAENRETIKCLQPVSYRFHFIGRKTEESFGMESAKKFLKRMEEDKWGEKPKELYSTAKKTRSRQKSNSSMIQSFSFLFGMPIFTILKVIQEYIDLFFKFYHRFHCMNQLVDYLRSVVIFSTLSGRTNSPRLSVPLKYVTPFTVPSFSPSKFHSISFLFQFGITKMISVLV